MKVSQKIANSKAMSPLDPRVLQQGNLRFSSQIVSSVISILKQANRPPRTTAIIKCHYIGPMIG